MTTTELIRALRELPSRSVCIPSDAETILNEAADQLEVLDERVAIMEEGNGTCELSSQEN